MGMGGLGMGRGFPLSNQLFLWITIELSHLEILFRQQRHI